MFADPEMMTEDFFIGPNNSLWQLRHTKFPVIAAVAGPCITGGFELALNCDIIIASKSAVFQDTHARYGIVPGGGMTTILPRSIGLHAAKWASLMCQRIPAQRAYELGLVAEVNC
jgi:enoyl-CoA hydratase